MWEAAMNKKFEGWDKVADVLHKIASDKKYMCADGSKFVPGQRKSLEAIADRLPVNGVIIADEVGMGKTRIATTVTKAVIDAGGRVAILVPPGLGFQWSDELRKSHVDGVPEILRSLNAYLDAWAGDEKSLWAKHSALIISHAFCNWQVRSTATKNNARTAKTNWKWSLLPQTLALVQASLRESGKMPKGSKAQEKSNDSRVNHAANWIAKHTDKKSLIKLANKDEFSQWGKESPLFNPENYLKHTVYREGLELVVGLGLGKFDLVVIDEAHKSRGAESNLNRLLKHVIATRTNCRRLAMTATPIELDVNQWKQILGRIDVQDDEVNTAIANYSTTVQQVRQLPGDERAQKDFSGAATVFQKTLGKYLLRRDKREVYSVRKFAKCSGKEHHDYRLLHNIVVPTTEIPLAWKQAVCAAEALSFVTRGSYDEDGKRLSRDEAAKRLRLTLGNGHGIAVLMDETLRDKSKVRNANEDQEAALVVMEEEEQKNNRKAARVEWWKRLMSLAFQGDPRHTGAGEAALYEHPAIRAAVDAIEAVCEQGEKVLVFGRFTRPMQVLVRLLNARQMLRCLAADIPWSQSKVPQDERAAVIAALRQLNQAYTLEEINKGLERQYTQLENEREHFRNRLLNSIWQGLNDAERTKALFDEFKMYANVDVGNGVLKMTQLALVARAVQEILAHKDWKNPSRITQAFEYIITAASDQDVDSEFGDDHGKPVSKAASKRKSKSVSKLWGELIERLHDEYSRAEGGFARLMNGETKPHTRRLLQLAFNREHSHPKVLVCQSVVGREGLNLHEACRTVILLHAEWNPGVVEQQIGRVDRLGSLWEKKLREAINSEDLTENLPRIDIRPVIFQGTYDENNWKVLMQRWDDLRAQLHGVVITPSIASKLPEKVVKAINGCAPKFSTSRKSKLKIVCTKY